MAARAISSATISFGLVSIPIKLYTATSAKQVRFNMLHKESSSRVKQQYVVPNTGEVVERKSLAKGYEYQKGQFVLFTEEELKKLETDRSSSLDILEFVPAATVDLIHVEKTYYLGPDKGGDKAYRLLSLAMTEAKKVALGQWNAKGKEQLVLVRPYKDGLMLHQLFYADEVRAFDDVDTGAVCEFKEIEKDLAMKLIAELSSAEFEPAKYKDAYEERVRNAVEQKVAGKDIQIAHEIPRAQIIDLFEALKQSLEEAQQGNTSASSEELKPRPPEKAVPRGDMGSEAQKTG